MPGFPGAFDLFQKSGAILFISYFLFFISPVDRSGKPEGAKTGQPDKPTPFSPKSRCWRKPGFENNGNSLISHKNRQFAKNNGRKFENHAMENGPNITACVGRVVSFQRGILILFLSGKVMGLLAKRNDFLSRGWCRACIFKNSRKRGFSFWRRQCFSSSRRLRKEPCRRNGR